MGFKLKYYQFCIKMENVHTYQIHIPICAEEVIIDEVSKNKRLKLNYNLLFVVLI